ncbi:hypothetical protein CNR22_18080 [Sphingobacteriaceae bacterium]|nr:hypothetical protein CNR22_18080 [Sphingobacteriaceae bacterium]
MKSLLLLLSGLLLSLFVFTGTSCQKETDCKATIKCVDQSGAALANASVYLYAQVKDPSDPKGIASQPADVKAEGVTDAGGEVKFTFKLPAIFNVNASVLVGAKTFSGTSIIKLEEGKTASRTITLQ